MLSDVGSCSDHQVLMPHIACDQLEEPHLCRSAVRIGRNATCAQLGSLSFLAETIESLGLSATGRGCRLYGPACASMVIEPNKTGTNGVFQEPRQFASTLLGLRGLQVSTYMEVGIHTAWTMCIIASYLSRFTGGAPFSADAVDIKYDRITLSTRKVMDALNITFHRRHVSILYMGRMQPYRKGGIDMQKLATRRAVDGRRIGLCFIDGNHSYAGVRMDYETLAPACRNVLFHDVADFDLWADPNDAGRGVPGFWAHLKANVRADRVIEFTRQDAIFPPTLGLGLLLANENGSALPDVADLSKKYYVGASFAYPPGGAEFKKPCIGCTHSVGRCFDEGFPGRPNYCEKYRFMKEHSGRCPEVKAKYVCQRSCGWCRDDTEAMPPKQVM